MTPEKYAIKIYRFIPGAAEWSVFAKRQLVSQFAQVIAKAVSRAVAASEERAQRAERELAECRLERDRLQFRASKHEGKAQRAEQERDDARAEAQRENAGVYHLRAAIIDALMNLGVVETDALSVDRLVLMIKRHTKELMPLAEEGRKAVRREIESLEYMDLAGRMSGAYSMNEKGRERLAYLRGLIGEELEKC